MLQQVQFNHFLWLDATKTVLWFEAIAPLRSNGLQLLDLFSTHTRSPHLSSTMVLLWFFWQHTLHGAEWTALSGLQSGKTFVNVGRVFKTLKAQREIYLGFIRKRRLCVREQWYVRVCVIKPHSTQLYDLSDYLVWLTVLKDEDGGETSVRAVQQIRDETLFPQH